MARARLGRRLTATILLLMVGLAVTCLLVLSWSQRQAQAVVATQLNERASASHQRQENETASLRDETLHQAELALHDKLLGMAALIAGSSGPAMVTEDYGIVETACQQAVMDPDALWCFVTKPGEALAAEGIDATQAAELTAAHIIAGTDFATRKAALAKATNLLVISAPIILDGKPAGLVTMVASTARLQTQRHAISDRFTHMATTADSDANDLKTALQTAQDTSGMRLLATIAVVSAVAIAIGFLLTLRLTRGIIRPIMAVSDAASALADGDLTQRITVSRNDEIGGMATALNAGMDHLQHTVQGISATANALGEASDHLGGIRQRLAREAETSADQARRVSGSTREMSQSLDSLAAGITEMGSTVDEIARNTQQAADVGREAVTLTNQTTQVITRLNLASDEVRGIVKTIAQIAQNTNLLALNATIEAASAGEAGRGFAVVANEVKNLAKQTAAATVDIERKVNAISAGSSEANAAIIRIAEISDRINQLQQAIASAVTEQAATTRELSGNVHQAAENSSSIATSISQVVDAAAATTAEATQTSTQAEKLAQLATELRTAVSRFRC